MPEAQPRYEELPPPAALAAYIACCWSFEIPPGTEPFAHALIPDGSVHVVLARLAALPLHRVVVRGPTATARWVTLQPGDAFRGVRLRPGASEALLGIAPGALDGQSLPLTSVHPPLAASLDAPLAAARTAEEIHGALTQGLALLASGARPPDPVIRSCVMELLDTHGNARIGELAQAAGISERQLRRRFLSAVGLTPKHFSRSIRVRAACITLAQSPSASLASVALEAGYADQAHLSREIAAVFGSTARGLAAMIRGYAHSRFQGGPPPMEAG